jgi:hypothetical protein
MKNTKRPVADVVRLPSPEEKVINRQQPIPRKHRFHVTKVWENPVVVSVVTALITLAVVFTAVNFHHNHTNQSQLQRVLSQVGRLMLLPQNEEPTLATVTDQAKLQGSLKAVAKTGDDVLVYQKHSEAIVYRPSANKIVAVEPVLLGRQPDAALTTSIAVLNGSGDPATMQRFITKLYELYPNLNLVYKTTAPRTFPATIVFARQLNDPLADELAKSLNIQSGQAPLGVSDNLAPITFIIGKDYH